MAEAVDDNQESIFKCVADVFRGSPSICTQQVYHTAASNFDTASLIVLGVTNQYIFFKVNAYRDNKRKRAQRFPMFFSASTDGFVEYAFTQSPFEWAKSPGYSLSDMTGCYTKPWHPWDVEHGVKNLPRDFEKVLLPTPAAAHGEGDTLAVMWNDFFMVLTADGRVLFALPLPANSMPLRKQIRLGRGMAVLGMERTGSTGTGTAPSVIVVPFAGVANDLATSTVQPINLNPGDDLLCIEACDVWNAAPGVSSIYVFLRRDGASQMREVRYNIKENRLYTIDECANYTSLPFVPLAARISEDGQVLSVLDTKMRLWLISHEGITPPVQLIVGGDQTPFFKDFRVLHEFLPEPPEHQKDEMGLANPKAIYSRACVILALNTGIVRYRGIIRYEEKVFNFNRMLDNHLSDMPEGIAFLEQTCYDSSHLVNSIAISPNWMCFALETQQVACVTSVSLTHHKQSASSSAASSSSSSSSFNHYQ